MYGFGIRSAITSVSSYGDGVIYCSKFWFINGLGIISWCGLYIYILHGHFPISPDRQIQWMMILGEPLVSGWRSAYATGYVIISRDVHIEITIGGERWHNRRMQRCLESSNHQSQVSKCTNCPYNSIAANGGGSLSREIETKPSCSASLERRIASSRSLTLPSQPNRRPRIAEVAER